MSHSERDLTFDITNFRRWWTPPFNHFTIPPKPIIIVTLPEIPNMDMKDKIDKATVKSVTVTRYPSGGIKIISRLASDSHAPDAFLTIYDGPPTYVADLEQYAVAAMERGGPKQLTFGDLEPGDRFRYIHDPGRIFSVVTVGANRAKRALCYDHVTKPMALVGVTKVEH